MKLAIQNNHLVAKCCTKVPPHLKNGVGFFRNIFSESNRIVGQNFGRTDKKRLYSVIVGVRDPNTGTDFLAFFAFLFVHILLYLSSFSFVAFILTILVVFIPLFFHILFIQIDTD